MTTIARTFVSVPQRSATETWAAIVDLIAPDPKSSARRDLDAVAGVACSCITDEALANDALVVYGSGPRVRIRALYGDDAIDGDGANESTLSFVPTDGDWLMSIPCRPDDLEWVQRKLKAASRRVFARALGEPVDDQNDEDNEDSKQSSAIGRPPFVVDRSAFFRT
jgi:hypothetical protein